MQFASFKKVITPPIGTKLAGYAANDISRRIHDDLYVCGLALDDGRKKVLMLSFDLLGLDQDWVKHLRSASAEIMQCPEEDVILSCTHTHQGPHTRSLPERPLDLPYLADLLEWVKEGVRSLAGNWQPCDIYFHSQNTPININRRVIRPDNRCIYLPRRRMLKPLADGPVDPELGLLILTEPDTQNPLAVVVNYAAHPLISHAPGLAGLTISADYPGELRKIIESNTGAACLFVSGACGDLFPENSGIGFEEMERFARRLALDVTDGIIDAVRNPDKFKLKPVLQTAITPLELKMRKACNAEDDFHEDDLPAYPGAKSFPVELQFLAIGDVCFIGVPGELVGEIGLEIKWHSPFRRTWILYNSTAYLSYICHGNAFVSGGYEAGTSHVDPLGGLQLLNTAIQTCVRLHPFPETGDN